MRSICTSGSAVPSSRRSLSRTSMRERANPPPASAEASAGKLFQAKIIFRIPITGCAAEFFLALDPPTRSRAR